MVRKVTVDDMVEAIRDSEKPLTEKEIGDRTGVTRPAISNYREQLRSREEICHGKVGKATAYWENGSLESPHTHENEDPDAFPDVSREETLKLPQGERRLAPKDALSSSADTLNAFNALLWEFAKSVGILTLILLAIFFLFMAWQVAEWGMVTLWVVL